MKKCKKLIFISLATFPLMLSGCGGLRKVSKEEFQRRFAGVSKNKEIVYRSMVGSYSIDEEKYNVVIPFKMESTEKTIDQEMLCKAYTYVQGHLSEYIADTETFYATGGFKIKGEGFVVSWNKYGDLTYANINEIYNKQNHVIFIEVTNHY